MTTKKVTLADKKSIHQLEKGSVVKRNGDLFMVAEIERGSRDPIHDALFFNTPPKYAHRETSVNKESMYNLVSLTTGSLFYDNNFSLSTLLYKVSSARFEVVDSIEFKEFREIK
jgi:hypothetical protein